MTIFSPAEPPSPTAERPAAPTIAGAAAIALALIVLGGWATGISALTSVVPGIIAMQPVTAIALILGGGALIAAGRPGLPPMAPRALAAMISLLAGADLAQSATGLDFGMDRLLFARSVAHQSDLMAHPGRMAEVTAIGFLFAAAALFLASARGRKAATAFSACATLIFVPVAVTLLGYLFGPSPLAAVGTTNVALPTATGLALLALGLLSLRPDVGWVALIRGPSVGAAAARRLMPVVLLVPIGAAWLAAAGSYAGFYPQEIRLALVTVLSIAMLGTVTVWAASRINRLDAILAAEQALHEAEHRLLQSQAELIHVARVSELGAMGAMLAHELNQPLAAVTNYVAAARRMAEASPPAQPRELRRALAHALASAERAGEVNRRLRAFAAKGEVDRVPSDVNAIIEDALVLALAGGVLKDAGTSMRIDPTARWVLADPIQIQQVINNLLRNAIDAMAGQARRDLVISTRRDGAQVEIAIADNGPGIAEAEREHIFASFYAAGGSGMGLGLSISRTIVEAHGGRIWAEGDTGGAIIRFTLPAAAAPRAAAAQAA